MPQSHRLTLAGKNVRSFPETDQPENQKNFTHFQATFLSLVFTIIYNMYARTGTHPHCLGMKMIE